MIKSWRFRMFALVFVAALAALITLPTFTIKGTSETPLAPPVGTPPPPAFTPEPLPPPRTPEEEMKLREQFLQEQISKGAKRIVVAGPETAGTTIVIAGRQIKLPPDAYVEGLEAFGLCPEGTRCPRYPLYHVVRGNSLIVVSIPTGEVLKELIAPREERAFDFLKEALR